MNSSRLASLVDLFVACRDSCVADVVHDRVIEEHWILGDGTNLATNTITKLLVATESLAMSKLHHIPVKCTLANILSIN